MLRPGLPSRPVVLCCFVKPGLPFPNPHLARGPGLPSPDLVFKTRVFRTAVPEFPEPHGPLLIRFAPRINCLIRYDEVTPTVRDLTVPNGLVLLGHSAPNDYDLLA